jgi:adenylate cyclase
MAELGAAGMTDYIAIPLKGIDGRDAITVATGNAAGFSDLDVERLRGAFRLFALQVLRHSEMRISSNALEAYLGAGSAAKVLGGSIKRGAGESIRAVIWKADLRNFTGMSDRIAGPSMLALLNAYFETMVGPVLSSGGEVLKFLGDGLLAVFPVDDDEHIGSAAMVALAAAMQAIAGLEKVNRRRDCLLPVDGGWHPLTASSSPRRSFLRKRRLAREIGFYGHRARC